MKVRWQDRIKGLDKRYCNGIFAGTNSPLDFDVRDTNETKWCYDLYDFLQSEGFTGGSYEVYIDETYIDTMVARERVEPLNVHTEIAYVKYKEDMPARTGGGSANWLCIYTRRDKDLRSVPGKMNRIPVVGHMKYLEFVQPDRITYLWIPSVNENAFRVKKYLGILTIQGIDEHGTPYLYRTEIK